MESGAILGPIQIAVILTTVHFHIKLNYILTLATYHAPEPIQPIGSLSGGEYR